jgi:AcrR family transcriptional regulator
LAFSGYGATNVNHLAELVGVGVGTIYNYFDDKDDLLLACVEVAARTDLRVKRSRVDPSQPAIQMLRSIIEVDYELLEIDPDGQQLLRTVFYGINSHLPVAQASQEFYLGSIELVEQALAKGLEEGVLDLGGDTRLTALVVNGVMETFHVLGDLLGEERDRGAGPALRALELVCNGILSPKGRAQLESER